MVLFKGEYNADHVYCINCLSLNVKEINEWNRPTCWKDLSFWFWTELKFSFQTLFANLKSVLSPRKTIRPLFDNFPQRTHCQLISKSCIASLPFMHFAFYAFCVSPLSQWLYKFLTHSSHFHSFSFTFSFHSRWDPTQP